MSSRLSTLDREVPLLTGKITLLCVLTLGRSSMVDHLPHAEQVEDVKIFFPNTWDNSNHNFAYVCEF